MSGQETPQTQPDEQQMRASEEEMRAAYEAELSRITAIDMIMQASASLLNIGGLRLGLVPDSSVARDLEQVRDAIDGVRALLPILERQEGADHQSLRPLRDALSQLQMAYTREVQSGSAAEAQSTDEAQSAAAGQPAAAEQPDAAGQPGTSGQPPAAPAQSPGSAPTQQPTAPKGPGPAESSGRLWVPGR